MLRLGVSGLLGGCHLQARDVHDALQLAYSVEEIHHRVVRTIQFHLEGHFGVEVFGRSWLGSVAPQPDPGLGGLGVHHLHEARHFFLVRNDLALDLQLLLEAGQLALDIHQLGLVGFQFRVFTQLGVQGGLGRRVGFALALE